MTITATAIDIPTTDGVLNAHLYAPAIAPDAAPDAMPAANGPATIPLRKRVRRLVMQLGPSRMAATILFLIVS